MEAGMKRKSGGNAVRSLGDGPVPYRPTKEDQERERRWRAEEDLRTLQRAREIEKDRSRVSACKSLAREQIAGLQKVTGGPRKGR
jgi:hypothetical protein